MANKKKNIQKRNSGCLSTVIWLFLIAFILVQIERLKDSVGDIAFCGIMLVIFIPLLILFAKSIGINRYMEKNRFHIVDLNNHMNNSYDMKDYFTTRDELIFHLKKVSKSEFLINKKNRLSERASVILQKLEENEDDSVNSALIRMAANYKALIRETETDFSGLFSDQIEMYADRLNARNRNEADLCVLILQKYERVVGKIEETDGMEGHAFEHWCARLLEKNGFTDVTVTPGSGDHGVDVLALKDGVHYAIQCKCYSSDLGNTPVQEVYAGKEMYGCQVGVVMTNRYFTAGAKQLADTTKVLLWDRDKLIEMLGQEQ